MKRKIDVLFLIISAVIGLHLGILGEFLYKNEVIDFGNRIICIASYLGAFALIMGVVIFFKGLRNSAYVNFGKVMALTLAAVIAFIGCSALFEFLYERNMSTIKVNRKSEVQYVFLIDDSSSMDDSDSRNQRFDAVEESVRNLKSTDKFAVYVFGSTIECMTPMGSENPDDYKMSDSIPRVQDGTLLLTAVKYVIEDVKNNNAHTNIVILTDGDIALTEKRMYNSIVSKCCDEDVSVSAIGFGDPNIQLLQNLSSDTGGTYVYVDDMDQLTTNVDAVVRTGTNSRFVNRDLLGYRRDFTRDSFLYGFLRVLFLILLGVIWSIVKLLLVGEKRFTYLAAFLSVALCAFAAILVEVLLLFGIDDSIARIIFCTFWACTLIPEALIVNTTVGDDWHSGQGNGNAGDSLNDFNNNSWEEDGPKSFL